MPWLSLALLLAMMLVVCVEDCDAKSKKTKKKKAGSTPKSPEKDDEEETKSKPKKPWNKMTKADWDRLEQEAEGPGEPFKMPEPPNVAFDPQNPQAFMEASKKGKPAMMFATLNKIKDEKTGKMRERDKPETEEVLACPLVLALPFVDATVSLRLWGWLSLGPGDLKIDLLRAGGIQAQVANAKRSLRRDPVCD